MSSRWRAIIVCLPVFVLFVLPQMSFAQATSTPCTCFCANPQAGALQVGEGKVTKEKCEESCKAKGLRVAVCAKTPRQFPSNNAICFDEKACAKQKGVLASEQAPECPQGWKYCFPTVEKSMLKLSTKIGNLETVGDLGEYVSGVYKWMIGVAGFLAIVMVLIGGLQWVLSAGGAGSIEQAKTRMRNGVIGIVLLFCVVLILQTVNPQLLKLEVPRPSKIRIVDLAANSCENFKQQGYELKPEEGSKEECGGIAVIKKGPNGTLVVDGLTCAYTKCEKGGCFAPNLNEPGKCVECRSVSKGNPVTPAGPSPVACAALGVTKTDNNGKVLVQTRCTFKEKNAGELYKSIFKLEVSGSGLNIPGGLDDDACFESEIDCSKINRCEDYNDKVLLHYFDDKKQNTTPINLVDLFSLHDICKDDPCKAQYKDEGGDKCEWGKWTNTCS